jgi:hypothetical protein
MTNEDREFMAKIAMVLIENRMVLEQLAETMDILAEKGLPIAANAAEVVRIQVAKINDVLGV